MKVARLYSFEDIRIEEMPVPKIGHGELLVQTKASGICSGDIQPWYMERKAPLVVGHEAVGVVHQVGSGVSRFKEGDRVILHHHAPCLECHLCKRQLYSMCPTWRQTNFDPGGMAEFIRLPAVNVAHDTLMMPDDMSFAAAALVEPVATSVAAFHRIQPQSDDTLVIIGLGVMGAIHAAVARSYGIKQIIGIDCVPYRLAKAKEAGAHQVIDFKNDNVKERIAELTEGRLATKIIVGPAAIPAMDSALDLIGIGGTICLFAPTQAHERWAIPPDRLYFEALTLTASYSCGPNHTKEALDIVNSKTLPFPTETIISHRFPLDQFPQAFRLMAAAQDSLKVMIEFD